MYLLPRRRISHLGLVLGAPRRLYAQGRWAGPGPDSAHYYQSEGQGLITLLSGAVRSQTLTRNLGLRFPPRKHVDAPDRLHTIPVQSQYIQTRIHTLAAQRPKQTYPTLTHCARVSPSRARSADAGRATSCKWREKHT